MVKGFSGYAVHPAPSYQKATLSRRELLRAMAAGGVAATMNWARAATNLPITSTNVSPNQGISVAPWTPEVQPFNLVDVRVLDGPFLKAQRRDEAYLLSLEPDRMLHNFRMNAGLEPKAPIYGGWESVKTWKDIRCHGHTLGHYLSACALMFASTNDGRLKQRCDYIIGELQTCQGAGKSGLVCAFPDGPTQLENAVAGKTIIGVPWYTMHKIFAGLRDAHIFCASSPALEVLAKLCDWADAITAGMTEAQFQDMLKIEHGGMNEVLADVGALTGSPKYLELAVRFCHRAVLEPLAEQRDTLNGLHSNTQIPKFIGFAKLYTLTGKPEYLAAAKFFWSTVVTKRSFVTGDNGDSEHFFPPNDFARHLGSAKTMETCCAYNMLRLTRLLFSIDPSAQYADYYERTLYNSILASQDPDSGMMTYYQPTRPGYLKLYCTPTDSFWCCTGTGMENHAKYGDSIYFHGQDSLFVNLFVTSTLSWKDIGLKLTQTTSFPDEATSKLTLSMASPAAFTMHIRHPAWCETLTIRVNGRVLTTSSTPGCFVDVKRVWSSGEVVELEFPMELRAESLPGDPELIAFVYGPVVLAGVLGNQGISAGADLIISERTYGLVLNDKVDVPILAGNSAAIVNQFKPVAGAGLNFTAPLANRRTDMTFKPYFLVAHERYSIYWQTTET